MKLLAKILVKTLEFCEKGHDVGGDFQKSINIRSLIRSYGWEKYQKLINVRRTFIWNLKVSMMLNVGF